MCSASVSPPPWVEGWWCGKVERLGCEGSGKLGRIGKRVRRDGYVLLAGLFRYCLVG